MALSATLRGMQPQNNSFSPKMIGDNVKIYGSSNPGALGSLILIMGYGAELSWTLTQWWYLHPAWDPSDQAWCRSDCAGFSEADKRSAAGLTNNLRIVDAVGTIVVTGGRFKGARTWYEYHKHPPWPDSQPKMDQFDVAVAQVFQLIERERKIVGDYRRITIAGMSQGADLVLDVGIRYPHQLGMVIVQRGGLLQTRRNGYWPSTAGLVAGPGTPFIFTAPDEDEITPLATYKSDCRAMNNTKTPVYFKVHSGYHGSFNMGEWRLLIELFSLMLSPEPLLSSIPPLAPNPKVEKIKHLAWWDSCAA